MTTEQGKNDLLEDEIFTSDKKISFPSIWRNGASANIKEIKQHHNSITDSNIDEENHSTPRYIPFQTGFSKKSPMKVRLKNSLENDNQSIEASVIHDEGSMYSTSSSESQKTFIGEVLLPVADEFNNETNVELHNPFITASTGQPQKEPIIEYDLFPALMDSRDDGDEDSNDILDGIVDKSSRQEILQLEDSLGLLESNFRQMLQDEDFYNTEYSPHLSRTTGESIKLKYHPTKQQQNEPIFGHAENDRSTIRPYAKPSAAPFDEPNFTKGPHDSVEVAIDSSHKIAVKIDKSTEEAISFQENTTKILEEPKEDMHTLHSLCFNARSADDNIWCKALQKLSMDPNLANVVESGWTLLHLNCLKGCPPPQYFIQGLVLASPEAVRITDNHGRLPLHLVAAKSADPDIMQLLVDEYPKSVVTYDKEGFLPLHTMLKNTIRPLTIQQLRILLGQTNEKKNDWGEGNEVSFKKQHTGESVKHNNSHVWRNNSHDDVANKIYPQEVKSCLKRLIRKKGKLKKLKSADKYHQIEQNESHKLDPASLPAPYSQLALHLAVYRSSIRIDQNGDSEHENLCDLIRVLVKAYPGAIVALDQEGRTPLLISMCCQTTLPDREIVELLLGRTTVGFESLPEWTRGIELHKARKHHLKNPAMIATSQLEQLPLHIAAQQLTSNVNVLVSIYGAYPGAIHVQDSRGRTPLHLAVENFQNVHLNPQVLALLLTNRVAQTKDDEGMIPFDIFVKNSNILPSSEAGLRQDSASSAIVYEQFFRASIFPKESNSWREANKVLDILLKLPPWIRNCAFSAGFVQDIVHNMLAEAPNFALLMFNGFMWVILLILIRLALNIFPSTQDVEYGATICIISLYLLFFQLLYCHASIKTSTLLSQCLGSCFFWVDAVSPILAIASVVAMANGNSESVAALGTATTGLLWANIIAFLTRWWHGMAVFIGGMFQLGELFVWPSITALVFIIGFAQMFHTLSLNDTTVDCKVVLGSRPLCDVWDSYVAVYLLLLGTPLVDTIEPGKDDLSVSVIVLIASCSLLLILFIINMIISVVLGVIQLKWVTKVSARYWESKLVHLFIFKTISSSICGCGMRWQNRLNTQSAFVEEYLANCLENLWDACTSTLFGMPVTKIPSCFAVDILHKPGMTFFFRLLIILCIPIWMFVGFITFGILWPPQVRRWFFRPSCQSEYPGRDKVGFESSQFTSIQNELEQLKDMCYGETQQVHNEISELQKMIVLMLKKNKGTDSWDISQAKHYGTSAE
mmetsp:Transcript_9421/g.14537  ORF Transcript_9421/g.14537 Transcript_9421/m.14537 type:complete len:1257 (+) Transcript_9421:193-3963(+)|eukprot:CAMPEP_0194235486 /NCGR_PEP_ID=MMETSP0158-20130606/2958_1 /TAXON_ID=33649 /ORGANISM="Thalassionema nitzschioides, Strain L26-B" /LENGTH=1256 /DNA_ID=CAMNT_0038968969 /DNA_START=102 /DNA_END=3872 /DNA_ORIENTATION=+